MDAVVREHQRTAYAAFLSALHEYERAVDTREARAEQQLIDAGASGTDAELMLRTLELTAAISIDEVLKASVLVELQGPEPVAEAARRAVVAFADHHHSAVPNRWRREPPRRTAARILQLQEALFPAQNAFTMAARAELNRGSSQPRRWRVRAQTQDSPESTPPPAP
ncbi:hypothetical protein ACGFYE_38240 [Streptomyces zaomyceticus]|uniref:hypothetical protein n=1 Tax=Streptomyces zaomyceticus TaxID=68286 RepID=UPI0037104C4E